MASAGGLRSPAVRSAVVPQVLLSLFSGLGYTKAEHHNAASLLTMRF